MRKCQFGDEKLSTFLLESLSDGINSLSNTERKIADAILNDPQGFITLSMTQLSKLAGVSQGSINNFSKKYSGGGFPTLKLKIAGELSSGKLIPFSNINNDDSARETLSKNIKNATAAFNNTLLSNTDERLISVAQRILKAKKVEIYGIFRSASIATDMYYQLLTLGIPANFVGDVLTCAVSASMLDSESLVIAVSSSGKTKDIIDAVKSAKAHNVPVVCITGNKNSPLSKLSDEVLIACSSGKSLVGDYNEIYLSQKIISDAICSYIRNHTDENGEKKYYELSSILNSHNVKD